MKADQAQLWLFRVLAFSTLSAQVVSMPLWAGQRLFPVAPLFSSIPALPGAVFSVVLLAQALLWAQLCLQPARPAVVWALLGTTAFYLVTDVARLQPWYWFNMVFLGLWLCSAGTIGWFRGIVQGCAAFYLWAGVCKFQPCFQAIIVPFMEPHVQFLPVAVRQHLGSIVPWFEVAAGMLLFIPKLRWWGFAAAVGTHLFIVLGLGPSGLGGNTVVVSWNLTMPALLGVALWHAGPLPVLGLGRLAWAYLLVFFLVVPGLHYLGLGHPYLANAVYTGRHGGLRARLLVPAAQLPRAWQVAVVKQGKTNHLDAFALGYALLNVPAIPTTAQNRAIEHWWEKEARGKLDSLHLHYTCRYKQP